MVKEYKEIDLNYFSQQQRTIYENPHSLYIYFVDFTCVIIVRSHMECMQFYAHKEYQYTNFRSKLSVTRML
jgi:hypothetical protein